MGDSFSMNTGLHQNPPIIVYPYAGSVFHQDLARRLHKACQENSTAAHLYSSAEFRDVDPASLRGTTLLIVNPWECVHELPGVSTFYEQLAKADKRLMVLAEAIEVKWFDRQFSLPIEYDAFIDVGFVSQEEKLADPSLPYIFLFHGPTAREEEQVSNMSSANRPIPWAFVGHRRDDRIRMAAEMAEKVDPAGLVFLPNTGSGVRKGKGMIGPSGMVASLSRTQCYVWRSHHDFRYYESFRFREAILAGAAPCKIDAEVDWSGHEIPGIFSSIEAFAETLNTKGFETIQESARDFYLSGGRLAKHLGGVLESV